MDPDLEELLKDLPGRRSRLEVHREFVLRLHRTGRSYRQIQAILARKFDIQISTTALFEFIQRRSRPRITPGNPPPAADQAYRNPLDREEPPWPIPRWTKEEIEAMRAKARASAHKPTTVPRRPPVFHYDPTRPLTNRPPDDKEINK